MSDLDFKILSLVFVLLFTMTLLSSVRWHRVCEVVACRLSWRDAWRILMVSAFFDQLIFNLSGDALRIWWLSKRAPSVTHAVGGVLLDRLVGLITLIILLTATLPFLAMTPSVGYLLWVPIFMVLVGIGGIAAIIFFNSLPLPRFPFSTNLSVLSRSARELFLSRRRVFNSFVPALGVHLSWPCAVATVSVALGVNLSLAWCFLIVPTVMLITLLPISIGGWGVREGAMVVGLGIAGVTQTDAVLISILLGLCISVVGLCGAFVWLFGLPPSEGDEAPREVANVRSLHADRR